MLIALSHIEAVLKAAKLQIILEDDTDQQNPISISNKAIVSIRESSTTQEATHFSDSVSIVVEIQNKDARKASELIEKIRKDATTRESSGVVGVVYSGCSVDENPYLESVKSYKMNFKIITITAR